MTKMRIKKGDKVVVLTGGDKGKTGEITHVNPSDAKVTVAGVNVKTHYNKPSQKGPGGMEKKEAPIHVSNVALVDSKSGKPTRVGFKIVGDRKVRIAKRSGDQIE